MINDKEIKLPVWIINTVLPLIIGAIGLVITINVNSNKYDLQIKQLQENVNTLQQNKVEKDVYKMLEAQLNRIETKVEELQKNQKQ